MHPPPHMLYKLVSSLLIRLLCPDLHCPANCAEDFEVLVGEGIYYRMLWFMAMWKLRAKPKAKMVFNLFKYKTSLRFKYHCLIPLSVTPYEVNLESPINL